jgi:hypothetical protein
MPPKPQTLRVDLRYAVSLVDATSSLVESGTKSRYSFVTSCYILPHCAD